MKKVIVADSTLSQNNTFGFKESIEIAKQLGKLNVDIIELPGIKNVAKDVLLIKTIASFVKSGLISVDGGTSADDILVVADALNAVSKPRIRISLPVSDVGMEYGFHKKGPAMAKFAGELVAFANSKCTDIEFCALDATRAEKNTLAEIIKSAVSNGAKTVTLYDKEGVFFPDEMAQFVSEIKNLTKADKDIKWGICCSDITGMAAASSFTVIKDGVDLIKTGVDCGITELKTAIQIFRTCEFHSSLKTDIDFTSSGRIISRIEWIIDGSENYENKVSSDENTIFALDKSDNIEAVSAAILSLGYDLSQEDIKKVYDEFKRIAEKKSVSVKEMEAIIASTALQVPPTYTLEQYSIQSGNVMTSSAQINMVKDGVTVTGISVGDGPIDAAFRTIEQITGRHFELDDFQIQAITEGHEAMGSAVVKLRSGGKSYSGKGLSTDIIGASIRAYISALNKILYEEA
ncbi:MAG: hypothetical protein IKN39_02440 [Clostridia bacterium]|nr:hypothetical protein [Clostridia bacterium]